MPDPNFTDAEVREIIRKHVFIEQRFNPMWHETTYSISGIDCAADAILTAYAGLEKELGEARALYDKACSFAAGETHRAEGLEAALRMAAWRFDCLQRQFVRQPDLSGLAPSFKEAADDIREALAQPEGGSDGA